MEHGTAQGRSFSVPVFNALLKWLQEEISITLLGGTRAWLPSFARALMERAAVLVPPEPFALSSAWNQHVRRAADEIAQFAQAQQNELAVVEFCSRVLTQFLSQPDRCTILELLGSFQMAAAPYVDDLTAPCASAGAVGALLRDDGRSASSRYASGVKARSNYGPSKTAAMPVLGSLGLNEHDVGCDVVLQRRLLGMLIDAGLSFRPHLLAHIAQGWSAFLEMFHAAEDGGFPVPVLAAQVCLRVEPIALFGAALLIAVPKTEFLMNRLQARWAARIIGCPRDARLPWALLCAQCGWTLRLGTRMREIAIMAFA